MSGPNSGSGDDGTRGDLDGALDAVWAEIAPLTPPVPPQRLRAMLREISVYARREQLQPEQLIISIKASWARTMEGKTGDRKQAIQTLSDVVTVCISEYFRED